MAEGVKALTYPVRLRVVGRYLSELLGMLALLTVPPAIVALAYSDFELAIRFIVVTAVLTTMAFAGRRLDAPEHIQANEGIVVVSLTFVLAPLAMAFALSAGGLGAVDALFEAVSAITTTGLSTIASPELQSPAFLFARAWMQWVGGLGIAVLSVALVMGHHAAARRLAEPTSESNLATTARTQARQLLRGYVLLTLTGTLLLWFALGDGFAALVHMLATLSTGGFSPRTDSLAALPLPAAWIVTAFSILGAVPLLLYHQALAGSPRSLIRDAEVRMLVLFVLIASGLLALSLWRYSGMDAVAALHHGFMLGASAQTTTGFASFDVGALDATSKLLLMFSMLVGGGSGSTAGGIKLLRLLIALKLLQHYLRRAALPPHAVARPRLAGQTLGTNEIEQATLIAGLFVLTICISWLPFVASGHAPLDALFEIISAVATVGLSTGITDAALSMPLKLLLCIDMLLGRLEVLALLVILYPPTWLAKRA
jgi:trk system potassium uptake protein TrkH